MGLSFTSPNKPIPMILKTKHSILISLNTNQPKMSTSVQLERNSITTWTGRKMERSSAMNIVMILLVKNVNLKPDVPELKKVEPSAGMLIRTFLTGLIHKPKGI